MTLISSVSVKLCEVMKKVTKKLQELYIYRCFMFFDFFSSIVMISEVLFGLFDENMLSLLKTVLFCHKRQHGSSSGGQTNQGCATLLYQLLKSSKRNSWFMLVSL